MYAFFRSRRALNPDAREPVFAIEFSLASFARLLDVSAACVYT